MPKKEPAKVEDTKPAAKVEIVQAETKPDEILQPYTVLIDGVDRVVFAADPEDLARRIAKIRAS